MRNTHVGPGIWLETVKNLKNEKYTLYMTSIRWENWKIWKMRHKHGRTCNMARNTENREKWEMYTVGPGYGKKSEKRGKWDANTDME